jgi:UDP-glucose 4-epimerase
LRTLVTGGGGFIGAHLVERLLREGYEVRVLDNLATGRRENLLDVLDDVHLVEGDMQSYERVHAAVRGCDVVFHQGALPSVPRSVQDPPRLSPWPYAQSSGPALSPQPLLVHRGPDRRQETRS